MSWMSYTTTSTPFNCAAVGRVRVPYRLYTGRPVLASVVSPTFSSASPRMPCSGLNSATSLTPSAALSRSIVGAPSMVLPVWLVTSATVLPFNRANFSARSTSMPGRHSVVGAKSAATIVATWRRNSVTLPLSSGWTRLVRIITAVFEAGSIQIEVPVNPVCPYPSPLRKPSPRGALKAVSTSQPRDRDPDGGTGRASVSSFTVSGFKKRTPSSSPHCNNMIAKRARSSAVLNSPACPASPAKASARGSWTTPRMTLPSRRPVGATRSSGFGACDVSVILSGPKTLAWAKSFSGCLPRRSTR